PLGDAAVFAAWADEYAAAQHYSRAPRLDLEHLRPRDFSEYVVEASEEIRLRNLGVAMARWFDGEQRWLSRVLELKQQVVLEIASSPAPSAIESLAHRAPWEVLATEELGHLCLHPLIRLAPIRRFDLDGVRREPSPFRLSVLFMAAQPRDVMAL